MFPVLHSVGRRGHSLFDEGSPPLSQGDAKFSRALRAPMVAIQSPNRPAFYAFN